jgi:hypothetical protein
VLCHGFGQLGIPWRFGDGPGCNCSIRGSAPSSGRNHARRPAQRAGDVGVGADEVDLVGVDVVGAEPHMPAAALQGLADDLLRDTGGVHVRGLDEIDARVEGAVDDPERHGAGEMGRLGASGGEHAVAGSETPRPLRRRAGPRQRHRKWEEPRPLHGWGSSRR